MDRPDLNDNPNRPSKIDTQRTLHGHPGRHEGQRGSRQSQGVASVDFLQNLPPQYEQVADELMHYKEQALGFIQKNPGVAVASALGVGYVVGKIIGKFS